MWHSSSLGHEESDALGDDKGALLLNDGFDTLGHSRQETKAVARLGGPKAQGNDAVGGIKALSGFRRVEDKSTLKNVRLCANPESVGV